MVKSLFVCILVCLSPVQLIIAQDDNANSIAELNTLLQKSKADSERVRLLLKATFVYVMRPGMKKSDFDSSLFFLTQAMNLSTSLKERLWQARCFNAYSQLYRESNQNVGGKKYIDSAISIFTKYNRKKELADAYIELRRYYDVWADDQWAPAIKYTEMAEQLYEESGNRLTQAMTLKDLGDFYQIRGSLSVALNRLYEALSICKAISYPEVQGIYDLIGYVFYQQHDYQQGLKFGLLALETAERLKTGAPELSTIYNRVGQTYYKLARYGEAANCFTKAFSIVLRIKDTADALLIATNLLYNDLQLGHNQEVINFLQRQGFIYDKGDFQTKVEYVSIYIMAYLGIGNYKKAEPWVNELIRLVGANKNKNILRAFYRSVIPYYFGAGQYVALYKYLPGSEIFCKKDSNLALLVDTYRCWYKADSTLGKFKDAIAHSGLYKLTSDSLLNFYASRQVQQLMIQFETDKKDQEIQSNKSNIRLLTSQAKLQQANLKQATIVKNLTIAGIVAVLIIAGLLFRQNRLKEKNNNIVTHKNEQLQHLLTEKEWLVKEIHHRVKNNLQIVMSLLNSQSAYIDNEPARTAIHDSQHRVHAMSLIHQKLYNSENNLSSIDMLVYARELVAYLTDSFNTSQRIRFELAIDPVEMDVSEAVPLGLILNEAITNSIKYAFPDGRKGEVSISLSNISHNQYLLAISDNGVGMPQHFNSKKPGSLGMSLMEGLSEDLDGKFSIENKKGTTIKISFAHDKGVRQPHMPTTSVVSS